jgi:hypothetical protein
MSRNVQSGAFTEPVSAAREGPESASCDVRAGRQELDVDHCHVRSQGGILIATGRSVPTTPTDSMSKRRPLRSRGVSGVQLRDESGTESLLPSAPKKFAPLDAHVLRRNASL